MENISLYCPCTLFKKAAKRKKIKNLKTRPLSVINVLKIRLWINSSLEGNMGITLLACWIALYTGLATRLERKENAIWRESAAVVEVKGSVVFYMCVCNWWAIKGGMTVQSQPIGVYFPLCDGGTYKQTCAHTNSRVRVRTKKRPAGHHTRLSIHKSKRPWWSIMLNNKTYAQEGRRQ